MATDTAVYWDASAVIPLLFTEAHSEHAHAAARQPGVHLVSSLAFAEIQATIGRLERERRLAALLIDAAREVVRTGPWRAVRSDPPWTVVERLSQRHPLRGADLWHLSLCVALRDELPELCLITFDDALRVAAVSEGITLV